MLLWISNIIINDDEDSDDDSDDDDDEEEEEDKDEDKDEDNGGGGDDEVLTISLWTFVLSLWSHCHTVSNFYTGPLMSSLVWLRNHFKLVYHVSRYWSKATKNWIETRCFMSMLT